MQTRNSQSVSTNGPLSDPQNPQRNTLTPHRGRQRRWANCQRGQSAAPRTRPQLAASAVRMDPSNHQLCVGPVQPRGTAATVLR